MTRADHELLVDIADQVDEVRREFAVLTLALHSDDLNIVDGGRVAACSVAIQLLGKIGVLEEDTRLLIGRSLR